MDSFFSTVVLSRCGPQSLSAVTSGCLSLAECCVNFPPSLTRCRHKPPCKSTHVFSPPLLLFFSLPLCFTHTQGLNAPSWSSTSRRRRRSDVTEEYIGIHLALGAICSLLPGFPSHKFCLTADLHSARSEGRPVTFHRLPDWLPRRRSLKWNAYCAASQAPLVFFCLFHFFISAGTSEPRRYSFFFR